MGNDIEEGARSRLRDRRGGSQEGAGVRQEGTRGRREATQGRKSWWMAKLREALERIYWRGPSAVLARHGHASGRPREEKGLSRNSLGLSQAKEEPQCPHAGTQGCTYEGEKKDLESQRALPQERILSEDG